MSEGIDIERKIVFQNKRINAAIQTAIELGELIINSEGYLSSFIESEARQSPDGGQENGWLIEQKFGPHIHWLKLAEGHWPRYKVNPSRFDDDDAAHFELPYEWTKDAGEGLRFARESDADAFLAMVSRFLTGGYVTEHQWAALSTPPADDVARTNTDVLIEALRAVKARGLPDRYQSDVTLAKQVDDALSVYGEENNKRITELLAANNREVENRRSLSITVRKILNDYQSSDKHHPEHILIRIEHFNELSKAMATIER